MCMEKISLLYFSDVSRLSPRTVGGSCPAAQSVRINLSMKFWHLALWGREGCRVRGCVPEGDLCDNNIDLRQWSKLS